MAAVRNTEALPVEVPSFGELFVGVILGTLFISFSFPIGLEKLAKYTGWPVLGGLGEFSHHELSNAFGATLALQSVSFASLWHLCFIGVGCYLFALAILSFRHRRFDLFALGVVFLAIGTASLHIITWTIWLIGWGLYFIAVALGFIFHILGIVFGFIFQVLGTIFGFLGRVLGAIFGFIGGVIEAIIGFFIKSGLWPIALLVLGGILIFVLVKYWDNLKDFVRMIVVMGVIAAALVGLYKLMQLIWPFLQPFFAFLGGILGAIGRFLGVIARFLGIVGRFLIYVFIALLVGWIIYGLGAILMDTFRGAWHSGNGRRGVIICSLSVGTLLALILMEANLYNVVSYYPSFFSTFALDNLHISHPLVDVLVCLLVLAIAVLGVFRNVPRMQSELTLKKFQTGFFMISLGLVVGIIFIGIAHAAQGSSS